LHFADKWFKSMPRITLISNMSIYAHNYIIIIIMTSSLPTHFIATI